MPLLDHFHPPLSRTHPWRSFHGTWAAAMARLLNAGILPPGYYAAPFLHRDGPVEIDVATLREFEAAGEAGGVRSWTPAAPGLAVAVEWPASDEVYIEIHSDDGDPPVTAAIELVSPGNKDRPRSREAFVAKSVEYLNRGCGLVVVDAVTIRKANLCADLLTAIGVDPRSTPVAPMSAVSYRALGRDEEGVLQAWAESLAIGQRLPTLPLWIRADLAVPLDLEASHAAACNDLRIHRAG